MHSKVVGYGPIALVSFGLALGCDLSQAFAGLAIVFGLTCFGLFVVWLIFRTIIKWANWAAR